MHHRILLALVIAGFSSALACDPADIEQPEVTTNPGSSSSLPECIDGEIGCPCIDMSLCEEGLICMEGICEDAAADGTGTGAGSGGSETGGEVGECVSNDDCDLSEICAFETCAQTDLFSWEMSVAYFEPGGCEDGWGTAEIFYRYFEDGNMILESSIAGCPAGWGEVSPYEPLSDFELQFWELDFLFDDYFTTICWPDDLGDCGPIPPEVLHDGGYDGYTGDGVAYFILEVEPVL